jgi:hypothetical protein
MKPNINDYKILSQHQMYYVLDPYDLFAMPCLKICGVAHDTRQEAEAAIRERFDRDLKTYERLKALGRSFPDND